MANLLSSESSTWARSLSEREKWHPGHAWLSHSSSVISSPLIGPGLVSTSPATTSNKDSARERDRRSVVHTLLRRPLPTSFPREESAPFPPSHTPVSTFPASESSSRTHNRGTSEITRSKRRCSGTRGRDPECAWYHRSFLFSHSPILARHSPGPLGGIFKIGLSSTVKDGSPPHIRHEIKARGSIVSFYIISLGTGLWVLSSAKRMTFLHTKSLREHVFHIQIHNDSWPLPRDYHELTSILLIQLCYLSARWEHRHDRPSATVWYVVSKAKIMSKSQWMHALISKVPACQYNQVLETLDPLATIIVKDLPINRC